MANGKPFRRSHPVGQFNPGVQPFRILEGAERQIGPVLTRGQAVARKAVDMSRWPCSIDVSPLDFAACQAKLGPKPGNFNRKLFALRARKRRDKVAAKRSQAL